MSKPSTTKRKSKKVSEYTLPKPNIPSKEASKKLPLTIEELEYLRSQQSKRIVFSFRFLELTHEAFNLGGTCNKWGNDVFKLFSNLSRITRNEFVNVQQRHYRSHLHNWDNLEYKYNFKEDFFEQIECRQARISTSKGGIHGFLIGNHFYVVWLDPHHNLYPDDRHGGLKIFTAPETCCGHRDEELATLNAKIKEYEELLDVMTSPDN